MSKWLSVCIFLLLAIACIVDVEPTEIVMPVEAVTPAGRDEPAERDAINMAVTPVTPVEIATPGALAWEGRTSAASNATEGNRPRAFATRGWSRAAKP